MQVDLDKIKALMEAMETYHLNKVRVKEENGVEIELEKRPPPPLPMEDRALSSHHEIKAPLSPRSDMGNRNASVDYITSPMVGTFYGAPSPDDPPFVKPGDEFDKQDVVCIIEAMKVMNEVKASKSGRIIQVLVENGQPVEFGTKLFEIQ